MRWYVPVVAIVLVSLSTETQATTVLFDNFEDGDYTQSPTWTLGWTGDLAVVADPLRPSNLVLSGRDNGSRPWLPLETPWAGFLCEFELYAPTQQPTNRINFLVHPHSADIYHGGYGLMPRILRAEGDTTTIFRIYEFDEHGPTHDVVVPNGLGDWWSVRIWHDLPTNLIHGELRRISDGALLGSLSFTPQVDLLSAAPLSRFGMDFDSYLEQYVDNVHFAPEPTTLLSIVLAALMLRRR